MITLKELIQDAFTKNNETHHDIVYLGCDVDIHLEIEFGWLPLYSVECWTHNFIYYSSMNPVGDFYIASISRNPSETRSHKVKVTPK